MYNDVAKNNNITIVSEMVLFNSCSYVLDRVIFIDWKHIKYANCGIHL